MSIALSSHYHRITIARMNTYKQRVYLAQALCENDRMMLKGLPITINVCSNERFEHKKAALIGQPSICCSAEQPQLF